MLAWLPLLKAVLSIAASIANIVREKQLMDAGEQRAVSKQLSAIIVSAGLAREVEAETLQMSVDQINKDLRDHGELRD